MDVEHEHPAVRADEVERGDVILVKGVGTLGEMITKLDGSPFSHAGVAMGDGTMLSCRTGKIDRGGWRETDIGGVRSNSFRELWDTDRDLYVGRTTAASRRADAPDTISKWEETKSPPNRSSFSFVKLFTIAAGLNAVRKPVDYEGRDDMLARACDVARAWDHNNIDPPSFFCSEAVASAFGATFAPEDFEPPSTGVEVILGTEWRDGITSLVERAKEEGGNAHRLWQLLRLVESIALHDRAFLGDAAGKLKSILEDAREGAEGSDDDESEGAGNVVLPTALVTPRMIRDATWVEWVAPIIKS